MDKETGKPKGYGFVEMEDTEEAIIAMKVLNGRELYDRNLTVNFAEQKQNKPDSRGKFHRNNDGRSDINRDKKFTPRGDKKSNPRGDKNFKPRDSNSKPSYKKDYDNTSKE
jgi:RNA recognition motif-containing protein